MDSDNKQARRISDAAILENYVPLHFCVLSAFFSLFFLFFFFFFSLSSSSFMSTLLLKGPWSILGVWLCNQQPWAVLALLWDSIQNNMAARCNNLATHGELLWLAARGQPCCLHRSSSVVGSHCSKQSALRSQKRDCCLSPFLTGRMFVRRTYFGHFDELWFVS